MGMFDTRAAGLLLHPTSLPGPHGIGDLGEAAHRFVDFLSAAGMRVWQTLPLGPTGYADSPYASFSSYAGNPLLISLQNLAAAGLLSAGDLEPAPGFPEDRVDFAEVIGWKLPLLAKAADRFLAGARGERRAAYERFSADSAGWLEEYALFMAVKRRYRGAWNAAWDRDIALREPAALETWRAAERPEIERQKAIQHFFFEQWAALRAHAAGRGVRLFGDLPVFVAPDSADVWADRRLFLLDRDGRPTVVSGVPPDYFSATGQLWGNPLYDWGELQREDFRWWVGRLHSAFALFDLVRIDHFRGFEACWQVPAGEPTAEHGRWVQSPGEALFAALRRALGEPPIVAEDLGIITPEVQTLKERWGLPGMNILQFAFDSAEAGGLTAENRFLPHNHLPHAVVYTGTHDNDTTRGWYAARTAEERKLVERYTGGSDPDVVRRFLRLAFASVCRLAVVPLQDALGLGSEARLNTPGTASGNWAWRFREGALSEELARGLRELAALYGR